MYIAEVEYPGTWLDYDDTKWSHDIRSLIDAMKNSLFETCIALELFKQQRGSQGKASRMSERFQSEEAEREKSRIEEIMKGISGEENIEDIDPEVFLEVDRRAKIRHNRERWRSGELPNQYKRRLIFMHAKSFLYSVDRISKLLKELSRKEEVPEGVKEAKEKFTDAFPDLRGVRNSSAHLEDRIQDFGYSEGEPDLEGGVLIAETLTGNRFGSTKRNGDYGEVEISAEKVHVLTDCIQQSIEAFDWRGPPDHYPK